MREERGSSRVKSLTPGVVDIVLIFYEVLVYLANKGFATLA